MSLSSTHVQQERGGDLENTEAIGLDRRFVREGFEELRLVKLEPGDRHLEHKLDATALRQWVTCLGVDAPQKSRQLLPGPLRSPQCRQPTPSPPRTPRAHVRTLYLGTHTPY